MNLMVCVSCEDPDVVARAREVVKFLDFCRGVSILELRLYPMEVSCDEVFGDVTGVLKGIECDGCVKISSLGVFYEREVEDLCRTLRA